MSRAQTWKVKNFTFHCQEDAISKARGICCSTLTEVCCFILLDYSSDSKRIMRLPLCDFESRSVKLSTKCLLGIKSCRNSLDHISRSLLIPVKEFAFLIRDWTLQSNIPTNFNHNQRDWERSLCSSKQS